MFTLEEFDKKYSVWFLLKLGFVACYLNDVFDWHVDTCSENVFAKIPRDGFKVVAFWFSASRISFYSSLQENRVFLVLFGSRR